MAHLILLTLTRCEQEVPFVSLFLKTGTTAQHLYASDVNAAQDVGTVDSGLNSMVLASNNERVLLPVNEPTFGTRRKSQIQVLIPGTLSVIAACCSARLSL